MSGLIIRYSGFLTKPIQQWFGGADEMCVIVESNDDAQKVVHTGPKFDQREFERRKKAYDDRGAR